MILTQVGFIVAFGVLLDTFVVRSLVVPAAAFLLGDRVWWPSRLARGREEGPLRPRQADPAIPTAQAAKVPSSLGVRGRGR